MAPELRACDLFSVTDTSSALEGATAVVISRAALVPPARFLQASRRATQLFALDTVARAARARGVTVHARSSGPEPRPAGVSPDAPEAGARVVRLAWQRRGAGVVSIQEMPARSETTAERALAHYLGFLPRLLRGAVDVRTSPDRVAFAIPHGPALLAFRTSPARDARRAVLSIEGGLLGRPAGGAFEFRVVSLESGETRLVVAVHGFMPRLPFPVYARTQARAHARVMAAFASEWEGWCRAGGSIDR